MHEITTPTEETASVIHSIRCSIPTRLIEQSLRPHRAKTCPFYQALPFITEKQAVLYSEYTVTKSTFLEYLN